MKAGKGASRSNLKCREKLLARVGVRVEGGEGGEGRTVT